MFFPLKLAVDDNTKKFGMAYFLYWMVMNDNSFLKAWEVLGVKSIKFVFSMFNEILFNFTQLYISTSSSLIFSSHSLQKKFVSSANKMGINKLDTNGKSM